MPRLLFTLPCRKLLINSIDNGVSILDVMEGLSLTPPPGAKLDGVGTIPLEWAVLSLWRAEPGDENGKFEQHFEIYAPDGTALAGGTIKFHMTQKLHRLYHNLDVFPVKGPGEYRYRVAWRREGSDDPWNEVFVFPLDLEIAQPKP